MKIVKWNVSYSDAKLIERIARRATRGKHWIDGRLIDDLTIRMDLTAVHANGNPLRLMELLDADVFNFTHDITGIYNHINRTTGRLSDNFSPQYSV